MNPLLLGGAALVALFAMSGSASASASQDHMVFKDYTWTTTLPAVLPTAPGKTVTTLEAAAKAGRWPGPHPLAAQLPAPPNTSATGGRWAHFPNGYTKTSTNFVFSVYPGCPGTVDVYAWLPNFTWNPAQPNVLPITKINGYIVTGTGWHLTSVQQKGPTSVAVTWDCAGGTPPPPPGATAGGHWSMIHPGYMVWLTPANANSGELASYGFNLGAIGAIPPPAAAPISSTPFPPTVP